jgi:hydrogenase maturation protease
MNPMSVLRMAASMGAPLKGILLLGCEPATLGPEEGQMGLSAPVEKGVDEAVTLLKSVISKLLVGDWPTTNV